MIQRWFWKPKWSIGGKNSITTLLIFDKTLHLIVILIISQHCLFGFYNKCRRWNEHYTVSMFMDIIEDLNKYFFDWMWKVRLKISKFFLKYFTLLTLWLSNAKYDNYC